MSDQVRAIQAIIRSGVPIEAFPFPTAPEDWALVQDEAGLPTRLYVSEALYVLVKRAEASAVLPSTEDGRPKKTSPND